MNESGRKYFTVDEANRTLPLVSAIVRDIVELYLDVHERRERLLRVRQLPGAAGSGQTTPYSEELEEIEKELDKDIDRLKSYTDELKNLGVLLKDPLVGLIDFYSKMDGRDVFLCWKPGEPEVAHWHELDAGFSGRQSLLEGSFPSGSETTEESP